MKIRELWNSIINAYTDEKRQWDQIYPWLYFVLRPVSFVITLLVLPLRITANQFTFIDFIVGATACAFLSMGYSWGFYLGSIMFTLYNLFDTVDGNIARCTKTASPVGRFFDAVASYPFYLVYFFIGIGLYHSYNYDCQLLIRFISLRMPYEKIGVMFIIIGSATTLFRLLSLDIKRCFFSILGLEWENNKQNTGISSTVLKARANSRFYKFYTNVIDIQGHDFLLIIAAFTHTMTIFLLASMVVGMLDLILSAAVYVLRAYKLR